MTCIAGYISCRSNDEFCDSDHIFDRCLELIYQRARTGAPIELDRIRELIQAFYSIDGNICGGTLHVALDDFNLDDRSLNFCLQHALENNDADGYALAQLLRCVPEHDRLVARVGEERAREIEIERQS